MIHKRKLCSRCEIGRYTYQLDKRSPECPYIHCHDGKRCDMFQRIIQPSKSGILMDFAERLGFTTPEIECR